MAEAIRYETRPARSVTTAREELDRLLETCHRHGLLRFANDLVAANTDVARVIVGGLQNPGTLNAIQNLSVLLMALSCVPPSQFYRLAFALTEGAAQVARSGGGSAAAQSGNRTATQSGAHTPQHDRDGAGPPGLAGAYRMLHDEQLWRAVHPLIEGLKAFASGLDRPIENPISDFTGKSGRTS